MKLPEHATASFNSNGQCVRLLEWFSEYVGVLL